jgi:hypothetical protein
MAKQFYRVYWTSNDGDEMVREIGLVFAENVEDALHIVGCYYACPKAEIEGVHFEDATYHAEPVTAYHLEDLLNNLFWQIQYSTCEESRRLIINGAIKEFFLER